MSRVSGSFGWIPFIHSVLSRAQNTEVHGEEGLCLFCWRLMETLARCCDAVLVLDTVLAVQVGDNGETWKESFCGAGLPTTPQSTIPPDLLHPLQSDLCCNMVREKRLWEACAAISFHVVSPFSSCRYRYNEWFLCTSQCCRSLLKDGLSPPSAQDTSSSGQWQVLHCFCTRGIPWGHCTAIAKGISFSQQGLLLLTARIFCNRECWACILSGQEHRGGDRCW